MTTTTNQPTTPTPRPLVIRHFCADPTCTHLLADKDQLACSEHADYFAEGEPEDPQ